MKLGLRIDVDTYRGTRFGVPMLCDILARQGIKGTFFFSVGPDNMGRHLWRLLKPAFLLKMLRSHATSLYGWDILLRGTFFPGPIIGERLREPIRRAADEGHEIGLHAWDHHQWQAQIDRMDAASIFQHLEKGVHLLTEICGTPPTCSASPAWKAHDLALLQKEHFPFRYNSDCRGHSLFMPIVDGKRQKQPQIPVTLPTYDEIIGQNGITNETYNEYLFSRIQPGQLNVLTIHAEVEGGVCHALFEDFLEKAAQRHIEIVPLGSWLAPDASLPGDRIVPRTLAGREGWLACQQTPAPSLGENKAR